MTGAADLAKMVPGFDFLQNLMKGASSGLAGLPGMNQWVAPTLDPEELDKRIQELKTVQFWLEQNARLLGTTIQALEVQRMTLATLQTMNLPMTDLRDALKINPAKVAAPAPAPAPTPTPTPAPEPAPAAATAPESAATAAATAGKVPTPPAPVIDPLQWWSALTQQFTELATKAVKDSAPGPAAKPVPSASTAASASASVPASASTAARPAAARKAAKKAPAARKRAG